MYTSLFAGQLNVACLDAATKIFLKTPNIVPRSENVVSVHDVVNSHSLNYLDPSLAPLTELKLAAFLARLSTASWPRIPEVRENKTHAVKGGGNLAVHHV